ncbi:hypothetical protein HPB50_022568 [Hyalomma asiaticum]|uniref:Uncharacterized protein n=1 Tax=Hyalomma asiaticum TaxID=266040 RepID=A0ACB7S107_HYAAI|nr:hypothetical protein HPB50_022568 [Hyalomma asiaticum]
MMADIASYDGHAAKRQRTDEGRDRGYGNNQQQGYNYYNNRGGGRGQEEEKPNHVLLMTILNPAYPITVQRATLASASSRPSSPSGEKMAGGGGVADYGSFAKCDVEGI